MAGLLCSAGAVVSVENFSSVETSVPISLTIVDIGSIGVPAPTSDICGSRKSPEIVHTNAAKDSAMTCSHKLRTAFWKNALADGLAWVEGPFVSYFYFNFRVIMNASNANTSSNSIYLVSVLVIYYLILDHTNGFNPNPNITVLPT